MFQKILSIKKSFYFQAQRKGSVATKYCNVTFQPDLASFSLKMWTSPDDDTDYKVTAILTTKVLLARFSLFVKAFSTVPGSQWRKIKRQYLDLNFNICQLTAEKNSGDLMVSLAKVLLAKYSTLPMECPVPAGVYAITNFTLSGFKLPFSEHFSNGEAYSVIGFATRVKGKPVELAAGHFYSGTYGKTKI